MSTAIKNLLVELFVEELPPKALKKLGDAFAWVCMAALALLLAWRALRSRPSGSD